jgi:hypothetical protein
MRYFTRTICILLCIWIGWFPTQQAIAATDEEIKLLLQKGLNVFEVDQELSRIQQQEQKLLQQISATEQELELQMKLAEETKRHAAKVLRAYYMGDRDSLWMLLFSISSFRDALSTLDYLQMIARNDHNAITRHTESQRQLKLLRQSLSSDQSTLQSTKERYISQREQMVRLQKQLDEDLSKQKEAFLILQQMTNLTLQWQNKGIPLFKMYFQALATAMKELPEIISDNSTGMTKHLIINGFQYTFQITDEELNDFLRSKNPIFQNLTFRFTDTDVIADGSHEGIDVTIKGKYEMATKDDGKGKPFIRFNIAQLQFNGFELPRSTIDAIEQEFDLGIYPQNLASFLQVTGLKLEKGKLSILLKLTL